jgi:hypothetical protein
LADTLDRALAGLADGQTSDLTHHQALLAGRHLVTHIGDQSLMLPHEFPQHFNRLNSD